MSIIIYPNKILNQKCEEIRNIEEARIISQKLINNLNGSKNKGAGLAAPQIGITKRVFIARDFITENKYEDLVFINPIITKTSNKIVKGIEGCLSIPDTYGYVNRPKSLQIEYTDINNKRLKLKTGGFLARIIQHEYDHIEGILFISKLVNNKKYTEKEIDEIIQEEK